MTAKPTAEFTVEDVYVLPGRGPCIVRSEEAASLWPGRGDPGCLEVGDELVCGDLRAEVAGIDYWAIPGPQPQMSILLSGVERAQLAVGQTWTRGASA